MSRPGRENVAEISRLCRAILTEFEAAGDDPLASAVFVGLLDEAGSAFPGRSLQFMAAMVLGSAGRLRRQFEQQGAQADRLLDDVADLRKRDGQDPRLVDDCMQLLALMSAAPDAGRDMQQVTRQIQKLGSRYGSDAMLELTAMAWKFSHDLAALSRGRYSDTGAVLAEMALQEERSLDQQGEA